MKSDVSFIISVAFSTQLVETEIFDITNIQPRYVKLTGRGDQVTPELWWYHVTEPTSDDINLELEAVMAECSKFLPNKSFYDVSLTVAFDPTTNLFFPQILRGKYLTLFHTCGMTLDFDKTLRRK